MNGIIQRGNPSIMKAIQQEAKTISESNGIAQPVIKPQVVEGGAAASIKRMNMPSNIQNQMNEMFGSNAQVAPGMSVGNVSVATNTSGNLKFDFTKSALERLLDSVELSTVTKEYVNTTQALFSLYALGYLDDTVLDKLSREDINEIKGIVREFKSILDSY